MPTIITVSSDLSYSYTTGTEVLITIASGTIAFALTATGTSGFTAQVTEAAEIVANAVLQEDGSLANATARKDYARLVSNNPSNFVAQIAQQVAMDGVTNGSSTDQAIVNRVLALWDQLSYGA